MSRQFSIADHERFLESMAPAPDFDEIDELVADPAVERVQRRSAGEVRRVLSILDDLESEGRP
jgi:hypothetical protein